MTNPTDPTKQVCPECGQDTHRAKWSTEGHCITCARDTLLGTGPSPTKTTGSAELEEIDELIELLLEIEADYQAGGGDSVEDNRALKPEYQETKRNLVKRFTTRQVEAAVAKARHEERHIAVQIMRGPGAWLDQLRAMEARLSELSPHTEQKGGEDAMEFRIEPGSTFPTCPHKQNLSNGRICILCPATEQGEVRG